MPARLSAIRALMLARVAPTACWRPSWMASSSESWAGGAAGACAARAGGGERPAGREAERGADQGAWSDRRAGSGRATTPWSEEIENALEDLLVVEALGVHGGEEALRLRREDHEVRQPARWRRGAGRRGTRPLATPRARTDATRRRAAEHHFGEVEARQLGEVVELGVHQPGDAAIDGSRIVSHMRRMRSASSWREEPG